MASELIEACMFSSAAVGTGAHCTLRVVSGLLLGPSVLTHWSMEPVVLHWNGTFDSVRSTGMVALKRASACTNSCQPSLLLVASAGTLFRRLVSTSPPGRIPSSTPASTMPSTASTARANTPLRLPLFMASEPALGWLMGSSEWPRRS